MNTVGCGRHAPLRRHFRRKHIDELAADRPQTTMSPMRRHPGPARAAAIKRSLISSETDH
jgi:hypothetical protein